MSRFDILAIFALVAVCALSLASSYDVHRSSVILDAGVGLLAPGLTVSGTLGCWAGFFIPWSSRASDRLNYVGREIGGHTAVEMAKSLHIAFNTIWIGGILVLAGPLMVYIAVVADVLKWPEGWAFLALIAAMFGSATIITRIVLRSPLQESVIAVEGVPVSTHLGFAPDRSARERTPDTRAERGSDHLTGRRSRREPRRLGRG